MVASISSSKISVLNNLSKSTNKEKDLLKNLSTGLKVSSGKDNAAALEAINTITAQLNGMDRANANSASAISALEVAQGGQAQTLSNLQELRSLAVQSADGSLSAEDRSVITSQAQSLLSSINSTASQLNLNGTNLLDGSFTNKSIQTGANSGDSVTVSIDSATASALGIDGIDLSSESSSSDAIAALDTAISSVIGSMGEVSNATQNIETDVNTNNRMGEILSASRSELQDTDIAAVTAELKSAQIKKQASTILLGSLNETEKQSSLKISV